VPLEGDWPGLVEVVTADRERVAQGGGAEAVARQHAKGRATARERIAALCDPGRPFDELMTYAGRGLYPEVGEVPAGGVVTGIGRLHGRPWMVIANDATVKAGAFFPVTAKKVIRAQTIALENRLPLVYLVDSAGVYLPMQDEVFPDQDDFGRVFYLNARLSALGVPQLAAILGNCVAGGAYLPVMSDALVMTEGSGLYLAGPALVRAAIGQQVDHEELGGAAMHAEVSGTVDFLEHDDAAALGRLRLLAAGYAESPSAGWARSRLPAQPPGGEGGLEAVVPSAGGSAPYDVRDVLVRLLDGGAFEEHKARYGRTLVCATGRLGGFPVGIVANQKKAVKTRGRLQVGGVIYADAADKAARFVMQCNQQGVPILFLQDVTGFMVGRDSEEEGIIRRGAKLVNAVSNSTVPKLTVILGGSFGAGHYALAGKAYGPRFLFALPSARYAVMGGPQAAKTLLDVHLAQRRRQGRDPGEEELAELSAAVEADYAEALDVRYGAARLWVDEVVLPSELRGRLVRALEACAGDADPPAWRTGVIQT
jgi:3-methylcrotonyl-CoA carboxylase beta subunit